MSEHYEAVVVGAGPAGLSAAMELSNQGIETLVLERGAYPGAKNATGGILYGQTNTPYNLDHLLPNFHDEAPVERTVDGYHFHCLAGDKVKTFDLTELHEHEHKWSYTVLRAKFDKWFADQVHKAARENGGGVLSGVTVEGPLFDESTGKIKGVRTAELDPITADLVIAADGATSDMVRQAGLRGWNDPENWFQGAKVVVGMEKEALQDVFGVPENRGIAHLFAGNIFDGVRGGGFLYTNEDSLSIGTVFHLDALAEAKVEPHRLMDRLLEHTKVQDWLTEDVEELEYSAKLIPDGKKMALERPFKDTMLAVGDAAGQLQAQGPIIKGMNLGITSGILAARAYVEAKKAGKPQQAGRIYQQELEMSYVPQAVKPGAYKFAKATAENSFVNGLLEWFFRSGMGRAIVRSNWGQQRIHNALNNPGLAGAAPDIRFSYVTLPTVIAEELGEEITARNGTVFTPRSLDERIGELDYDTDIGHPHIELLDKDPRASGMAVHTCPVSARDSSRGCYRLETIPVNGSEKQIVALDTQPCIECGTCAIMAQTDWDHPRGGKGVEYKFG